MARRRVLIVDDSVVIRRALRASLAAQPAVDVAGSASTGLIALMKIPLLQPDVVALDIEMPGMNGLQTLAAIRQRHPRVDVIMLGVPTPEGTAATVDALTRGASDYVMKPGSLVPGDRAMQLLSDQLMSKIAPSAPAMPRDHRPRYEASPASGRSVHRVDVVAIGISTGGPRALMDLLPEFPSDFPAPILIVQHMPQMFTRLLADRLGQQTRIPVAEAGPDQALEAGHVWIAPGDFHMAVARHGQAARLITHQRPAENSCRPSADVLFRSVTQVFGPHVLAVVMTGMGQDGVRGCQEVRAAGGQVLVQDEASSVVWGMPGSVARAGLADRILPLSELGQEIVDRVRRYRQLSRGIV